MHACICISDPKYLVDSPRSAKHWLYSEDKGQIRLRVRIRRILKLVNNPIMREELKNIPALKDMKIFRQPQGTNFPVSRYEWEIISGLIKQRLDSKA